MNREKEQSHPLYDTDRQVVDQLLTSEPTDHALAEWARLQIRYQHFPGARDIQNDLGVILARWELTQAEVFARTRVIHRQAKVYRSRAAGQEDWN
ncbi:MAG: DUF3288 family protein [Gloeomargarita sp. DG02_3_bins_56]